MRFLLTGLITFVLLNMSSQSALATEDFSGDIRCNITMADMDPYFGGDFFRFTVTAKYIVTGDNEAQLVNYKWFLVDEDLYRFRLRNDEGELLENDKNYRPRKYKGHLKFAIASGITLMINKDFKYTEGRQAPVFGPAVTFTAVVRHEPNDQFSWNYSIVCNGRMDRNR